MFGSYSPQFPLLRAHFGHGSWASQPSANTGRPRRVLLRRDWPGMCTCLCGNEPKEESFLKTHKCFLSFLYIPLPSKLHFNGRWKPFKVHVLCIVCKYQRYTHIHDIHVGVVSILYHHIIAHCHMIVLTYTHAMALKFFIVQRYPILGLWCLKSALSSSLLSSLVHSSLSPFDTCSPFLFLFISGCRIPEVEPKFQETHVTRSSQGDRRRQWGRAVSCRFIFLTAVSSQTYLLWTILWPNWQKMASGLPNLESIDLTSCEVSPCCNRGGECGLAHDMPVFWFH